MPAQPLPWWRFTLLTLRETGVALVDHRTKDVAAQLAFWSLLAVFPFTIFLLTVIGYIPLDGLDRQLMSMIYEVMPREAAKLFDRTVHEVLGRQRGVLLLASLAGWVWSASGGMGTTAHAINLAYGVPEKRSYWTRRVLWLALTAAAAGAIIVATAGVILGPSLLAKIGGWVPESAGHGMAKHFHTWAVVRWPLVILSILSMLGCLYHFLLDKKQPFRLFTVGSVVALGLWIFASLIFNYYVRHFHSYARTYGALGGAVILIMWLYLTGLVIIVGAEINAAIERVQERETARLQATLDAA